MEPSSGSMVPSSRLRHSSWKCSRGSMPFLLLKFSYWSPHSQPHILVHRHRSSWLTLHHTWCGKVARRTTSIAKPDFFDSDNQLCNHPTIIYHRLNVIHQTSVKGTSIGILAKPELIHAFVQASTVTSLPPISPTISLKVCSYHNSAGRSGDLSHTLNGVGCYSFVRHPWMPPTGDQDPSYNHPSSRTLFNSSSENSQIRNVPCHRRKTSINDARPHIMERVEDEAIIKSSFPHTSTTAAMAVNANGRTSSDR